MRERPLEIVVHLDEIQTMVELSWQEGEPLKGAGFLAELAYQQMAGESPGSELLRHVAREEIQRPRGTETARGFLLFYMGLGYIAALKKTGQISAALQQRLLRALREVVEDYGEGEDLLEHLFQKEPTGPRDRETRARALLIQRLRLRGCRQWLRIRRGIYAPSSLEEEEREHLLQLTREALTLEDISELEEA